MGVAPTAQLGSWEGDLLVLAVPEEDFATEGERQGGREAWGRGCGEMFWGERSWLGPGGGQGVRVRG